MLREVCLVLTITHLCHAQSAENYTKLLRDVITIDQRVRPVRVSSTQMNVTVSFHLMSIADFDTVNQKLSSNGWLQVSWTNEYTVWDPADYEGALVISPNPDKVWRPRITIMNTMKDLKPIGEDYIWINVLYNGTTFWFPGERFETFCSVDVTYFPFDIQHCRWEIFVWGEDITVTDLQLAVAVIELDTFSGNGEWELVSTRAWRSLMQISSGTFPFLFYEATLRRRPSLMVLTVMLPVSLLATVNTFVFTIPSESGERLSYAITSLLSFGVFMSFIMDSMPSATETISIVAIEMSCLLFLSAIYVLCCILSLRLFHRDDLKHPVPKSLQTFIVWLEVLVCLDPPVKNKVGVMRVASVTDGVSDAHFANDAKIKSEDVKTSKVKAVLRKWRHDAYTDPAEMTWRRVSRTLDKLFFRMFLVVLLSTTVAVVVLLLTNYVNYD